MSTPLVIALRCPGCAAGLKVAGAIEVFACAYCGVTVDVRRQGGTVSLELASESLARVEIQSERTAAELAIRRLNEEIRDHELHLESLDFKRGVLARQWESRLTRSGLSSNDFAVVLGVAGLAWILSSVALGVALSMFHASVGEIGIALTLGCAVLAGVLVLRVRNRISERRQEETRTEWTVATQPIDEEVRSVKRRMSEAASALERCRKVVNDRS